ncbi:MAG: dehydrogenase, partial [Singulisphaera sp.]
MLARRTQTGEVGGARLAGLRERFRPIVSNVLAGSPEAPLYLDAALLAASWKDPAGLSAAREAFHSTEHPEPRRLQALQALIGAKDDAVLDAVARTFRRPQVHTADFRGQILAALGDLDEPRVAEVVLAHYPDMEPALKPRAIELLTQRDPWGRALLQAVARKHIAADVLNLNQVRKLLASKDPELVRLVKDQWGTVREGRNPGREQVIKQVRASLRQSPGDPSRGALVFKNLCAQCHKIYGEGQDVGPDITLNGRGSFDQLLSNLFDPSLVIGVAYQATTVATEDGRVL